jgi:hypothetical protein
MKFFFFFLQMIIRYFGVVCGLYEFLWFFFVKN